MPARPQSDYTPFNASPSGVVETQSPHDYLDVRADPDNFGAQIGQATQGLGKNIGQASNDAFDIATKFAQQATEAKVNDDYANKYAPAAADLRNKYDQLQGQDKVAGYGNYVQGLQDLNQQFSDNASSPYEKQLMGGLISRHIFSETQNASRELAQSQKEFSNQAAFEKIAADSGYAAQNYNNPAIVNQVDQSNRATVLMNHVDAGHAPDSDEIKYQQDAVTGNMAVGMINSAVSRGDAPAANQIRSQFGTYIPGYQQTAIDNLLHTENIRQTSQNSIDALKAGQPLPQATGAPAYQVQATVANAAQGNGIDPNAALTVLRIESNNGQNLGTRGTIGQDKESAGKPLTDQAQALCDNWKAAAGPAQQALGRQPEGWEQYAVYQQGAGGGAALLKADPNAKAIDVLKNVYDSPKDAISAIVNNGGNATMTVGDFLGHIQQTYSANAQRANCDFSNASNAGDAITAPHETPGQAVQPAATPTQAFLNFQSKSPAMLEKINSIPNYEVRQGVMRAYNQETQKLRDASTNYSSVLLNKATQMAVDPKFTDLNQVPPDMMAALVQDHPQAITMLEARANYNATHAAGGTTKDEQTYGAGYFKLFNAVHADPSNPDHITSATQLMGHLNNDLTVAGYDRLTKDLAGKNTPDGDAESKMKDQSFKVVKNMLSGADEGLGLKDPKGEELMARAMPAMYKAIDEGKEKGLSMYDLYDPSSKNWIGNAAKPFKRSVAAQMADMQAASSEMNLGSDNGTTSKISMPPPISDRVVGQSYQSPRGMVKWTGQGWASMAPSSVPMAGNE